MKSLALFTFALFCMLACFSSTAHAQTNLTGTYAHGQVFLRWTLHTAPVYTYDIYASFTSQTSTTNMTLVGRIFPEEAVGSRLRNLVPTATLRVPTANGNALLASTEGAFAWTPHQEHAPLPNNNLYFAVVRSGQTAVTNDNRVQVTYRYDPVNEPVKPHFQFASTTQGGYPYNVYMVWVDGRENPEDGRPDFPVMANAKRGGVPHVFVVTAPIGGLPAGPYPAVFSLHGGEGAYQNFMPGEPSRTNMSLELTNGIVITPDDNVYWQGGIETQSSVTAWFGYAQHLDPFQVLNHTDPPSDEVIVNYTSRRVLWFTDWLTSGTGPYNVDPHRIALIGHSAGSRGASTLSRQAPSRFSSVIIQSSLLNYPDPQVPYPLSGKFSQNLATNIISPDTGLPVTHQQALHPTTRLSNDPFIPYTRLYVGKRDENLHGGWTPTERAGLDDCNNSQLGIIVSWDEREHNVGDWATETPDLLDDPLHCEPWPDIAQWIYPIKTERHSAQYLADHFRNDISYPGFFDVDSDITTQGRQPEPGSGDPCANDGTPWGTWGGYLDWNSATIIDTPTRWECDLYLRGLSPTTIDNSPSPVARTSLAPRRTQQFQPAPVALVHWILQVGNQTIQAGTVVADQRGIPKIRNLLIPREDLAIARLILSTERICDSIDFNNDTSLFDPQDIDAFLSVYSEGPCVPASANCNDIDFNNDTSVFDPCDINSFLVMYSEGPCTPCGV